MKATSVESLAPTKLHAHFHQHQEVPREGMQISPAKYRQLFRFAGEILNLARALEQKTRPYVAFRPKSERGENPQ